MCEVKSAAGITMPKQTRMQSLEPKWIESIYWSCKWSTNENPNRIIQYKYHIILAYKPEQLPFGPHVMRLANLKI